MQPQLAPEQPRPNPKWLLPLIAALAVAGMASAIVLVYNSSNEVIRYRVIILLMFFSISTASSLIFSAKANLEGNLYGLALTIGGPATLWIIALLLFSYEYPPAAVENTGKLSFIEGEKNDLTMHKWQWYPEWRREQDRFLRILGPDESDNVRSLLWYAYYRPEGGKLEKPTVSTVFVYLPDKTTLKFQRITGPRKGEKWTVPFAGAPSTPNGQVSSMILSAATLDSGVEYVQTSLDAGGTQRIAEVPLSSVDALLVSLYEGDDPGDGDYTVVDLKRYSANGDGTIHLGMVSFDRTIKDVSANELSGVTFVETGVLPLVLRPVKEVYSKVDYLRTELAGWLGALDKRDAKGAGEPNEKAVMSRIAKHLAPALKCKRGACFSAIFDKPKDSRAIRMANTVSVALMLFRWE